MEIVDRLRQFFSTDHERRPAVLSDLAERIPPDQKGDPSMSIGGLRQRLEGLEGVSAIHLELADDGLSGIRVSLDQGADEAAVLERIRSLLVTYGLRSPTPVSTAVDQSIAPVQSIVTTITPEGEGMRVEVSGRGESVVKLVEATPLAAAQAVAEGRARLGGGEIPKVLWIGLDAIGDWRILTVLLRDSDDPPMVGSSVVLGGWAEALDQAVTRALD